MSSRLEVYLSRLRKELRTRWLNQDRLVAEAREHLVDRIEDGRRRGLSPEAAEQEAFDGFGSPETIAECAAAERNHMWECKWWVLIPTIALAIIAGLASYYLVPVRYQSEALLEFIPVSAEYVPGRMANHLKGMSDLLTSTPRLERVIEDLNLYESERRTTSLSSVVRQMRHDISITVLDDEASDARSFVVRFAASDPRLAQRGTARLASAFIEANFVDVRATQPGVDPRTAGEQLRIIDPPTVPERPVGLSPVQFGAVGAVSGLVLGLTSVGVAMRRRRHVME